MSGHLGRPWAVRSLTDLNDRASHPCGILHGDAFSVFAKLAIDSSAVDKFEAELRGLELIRERARVATPTPIGNGLVTVGHGAVLVTEALAERPPGTRTREDWRSIGRTLAALHDVHGERFGLPDFNGFFGPLGQNNAPVISNPWSEFYVERRVEPYFELATRSGRLPVDVAAGLDRLLMRLPDLCGPEPEPTLLHGDAQQNNFVTTDSGALVTDVAPYYGHPEIDLALVDYFHEVPDDVLNAYREVAPFDPAFAERRALWLIPVDLACIAVDAVHFGPRAIARLSDTVGRFR